MSPLKQTELDLQFAASISPLWLLLLVPVVAASAWWLYRDQWRDLTPPSKIALTAIRIALLVLVVVLAFRPSIIMRDILSYPGRILLLIDNSTSMETRDTAYSAPDAAHLARQLGLDTQDALHACYRVSEQLVTIDNAIGQFERFSRDTPRSEDRFWDEADTVSATIGSAFQTAQEEVERIHLEGESAAAIQEIAKQLSGLATEVNRFFQGEQSPGARAFAEYRGRLQAQIDDLLAVQAAEDTRTLANGNPTLSAAIDDVRNQGRLNLIGKVLTSLKTAGDPMPGQYVRFGFLDRTETQPLAAFDSQDVPTSSQPTNIHNRVSEILNEDHDFPLTSVVLLSDGLDHSSKKAETLGRLASRKRVPVAVAAAGAPQEPVDVAVLGTTSPPFAVKGFPFNIRVRLKAALPEAQELVVRITQGTEEVAQSQVAVSGKRDHAVTLQITPAQTGRFRYQVSVESVSGEVFPKQNNAADFAVNVRREKMRVLLLDWKPRWQTRFALNILQRLDYIDLNAIIVVAQPGSKLVRGLERGTWPQDAAGLDIYDLVVLGDLPTGLLSQAELDQLQTLVADRGKTLCILGNAAQTPIAGSVPFTEALSPLLPSSSPAEPTSPDLPELSLSKTGALHVLTSDLQALPQGELAPETDVLHADSQPLLLAESAGTPLLAARFVKGGSSLLLGHDMLWKRLNPTMLNGHAGIFVNLVTWAIDSRQPSDVTGDPALLRLDRHMLNAGDVLQAWVNVAQGEELPTIEVVDDGQVVMEAQAEYRRQGASKAAVAFAGLPAKNVSLRVRGKPESAKSVIVIDDNPELRRLARNDHYLETLSSASGGQFRSFTELKRTLANIEPKERIERRETTWVLWDSKIVLALVMLLLTVEWVWRKFVGLV